MAYALIVLAIVVVLGMVAERRHERVRRRLGRLEARDGEIVNLLRGVYAERARGGLEGRESPMAVEFRAEFGEDLFLYELFDGATHGYFIEAGAFDGYTYAVTYAFEAMGWDGLLVEPVPSLCEKVRARRHVRVENVALGGRGASGTARFVHLQGAAARSEAASHLEAANESGTPRPRRASAATIEVPLTSMDALLEGHEGVVDLAVIDVEGAELSLLSGFDLARHGVRVILIEDHSMGADRALIEHLTSRGYEHVCWLAYNRLLVRSSEGALLARARQLAQVPG